MDNSLTKRYFTYLTVLILSSVAVNGVGWNLLGKRADHYYDLINISGKQRMLTQRIAYYATRGNPDPKDRVELQKALDLIKQNHLKFTQGSEDINLSKPQQGDALYDVYFGAARLDKGIHHLIKSVQAYVDSEGEKRPFKMKSSMPNQLLSKTNLAVELYLQHAKEQTRSIINWLVLLNFVLLVAVLLQMTFIYNAIFKPRTQSAGDVMAYGEKDQEASPLHGLDGTKKQATSSSNSSISSINKEEMPSRHQDGVVSLQHPIINHEYKSDLPHPLECIRFLFVDYPEQHAHDLKNELSCIIGTEFYFAKNLDEALIEINQREAQHRPLDIIFSSKESDFFLLQKHLIDGHLKQDYCHLLLWEKGETQEPHYITFADDSVVQIVDAFKPYEKLLSHSLPEYQDKKLLLVDDNEINLMVLEGMVQKTHADCMLARDGQQALDLAKQHNFDLIFMDLQMPVMNGYESVERILSQTKNKNTPIIAVTANHHYSDRRRCIEIGMTGCEAKPVNHATIEKLLYKYLS